MKFKALAVVFFLCAWAAAQSPGTARSGDGAPASTPSVTFTFVNTENPAETWNVVVDANGAASYETQAPVQTGGTAGDPFKVKLTVSPVVRDKIFDNAKLANYFSGDFEYRKHRIAYTGSKTLTFQDGQHKTSSTFNWSENPSIQELSNIFMRIHHTLEFGRRLTYMRRFDKLGIDAELKRMEQMQKDNWLGELQAIAPILQQLANDTALMRISRERAQRLLAKAGTSNP